MVKGIRRLTGWASCGVLFTGVLEVTGHVTWALAALLLPVTVLWILGRAERKATEERLKRMLAAPAAASAERTPTRPQPALDEPAPGKPDTDVTSTRHPVVAELDEAFRELTELDEVKVAVVACTGVKFSELRTFAVIAMDHRGEVAIAANCKDNELDHLIHETHRQIIGGRQ